MFKSVFKNKQGEGEDQPMYNNYRDVQDLNGREIYKNFEDSGSYALTASHLAMLVALFVYIAL